MKSVLINFYIKRLKTNLGIAIILSLLFTGFINAQSNCDVNLLKGSYISNNCNQYFLELSHTYAPGLYGNLGQFSIAPVIDGNQRMVATEDIATSYAVYPNPVMDFLYFESSFNSLSIKLFNGNGQVVISKVIDSNEKLDCTQLPLGVYFLKIYTSNSINQIHKIIKI